MRKLTLSIAVAALATAGTAFAAPGAGGARMPQGDMTRAQVEAKAAERFAKMDANGDGVLNPADRAAMRAKMFDRIDADKNGSISRAEFEAMHAKRAERARSGKRGDRAAMAGHRMGGHKMGARGGRGMMGKMADANSDGAISRAEFTAAALKRFDAADADRNGTVTQAERQAGRQAMRAQMKSRWEARKAERQAN